MRDRKAIVPEQHLQFEVSGFKPRDQTPRSDKGKNNKSEKNLDKMSHSMGKRSQMLVAPPGLDAKETCALNDKSR
jgi:hypothetical protein